jgi:DNA polymerase-1
MKLNAICPPPTYINEDDEEGLEALIHKVEKAQEEGVIVAVDTETTGLNKQKDHVVVWSICFEPRSRYTLSFISLYEFKPLFENPNYKWVFTNAKYDLSILSNSGVEIAGHVYDTLIMDWLLDPDKANIHDLKSCAYRHLGIVMRTFKEVFPDSGKKNQGSIVLETIYSGDAERVQSAIDYAAMDAWATFSLNNFYRRALGRKNTWRFIEEVYVPLVKVLWRMERRGVLIDADRLRNLRAPLLKENNEIEKEINKLAGRVVNPRSTPQLRSLLIDDLGLPVIKMTNGGKSGKKAPSVDKACLAEWAKVNKVAERILRHRQNTKNIGTYIDGIINKLSDEGRIHTTLNAHIASTGRLSSSNPNLQNIPGRTMEGEEIRKSFIASPGKIMIVLDYSQVEMMIAAHFSNDPNMISAIKEGRDLHSANAAIMFNVPYEKILEAKKAKDTGELTPEHKRLIEMRTHAKTIGFGLLYGMGASALANDLNVSIKKAEELMGKFFERFPGIEEYTKYQQNKACTQFEVNTIIGRPRYIQGTRSNDRGMRGMALRAAVNTPIQGSAADIINSAMVQIENDIKLKKLGCDMLLQVHDELIFECTKGHEEEAAEIIRHHMENTNIKLKVPLKAEPGFGKNWIEAK